MDDIITIPEPLPTPKTYKEWAVAKLRGLDFTMPVGLEPKTPIEQYLAYAIAHANDSEGSAKSNK